MALKSNRVAVGYPRDINAAIVLFKISGRAVYCCSSYIIQMNRTVNSFQLLLILGKLVFKEAALRLDPD